MAWFKADDQLSRSKKVLRIPRRYRMQSMGLWILSGTWSAGELTDGFVPSHMLDELGGTAAQAKRLVESGLWSEVAGGFQFNSWSDFQPSSNDVREKRARDAERKQKAREEKRRRTMQAADQGRSEDVRADAERTDHGVLTESTRSPQSVRSTRPDPTRPDLSSTYVERGGLRSERASDPPTPRCPKHINDERPPACGACADARRAREAWDADEARSRSERQRFEREQQAADIRAEIDACELCDERGYVGGRVCDHDPEAAERNARGMAQVRAILGGGVER